MEIASKIMVAAINEVNTTTEENTLIKSEDSFVLMGANGSLDSLSLVRLFVTIESKAEEIANKEITLLDESSFEDESGPFGTVGSLKRHINKLLSIVAD